MTVLRPASRRPRLRRRPAAAEIGLVIFGGIALTGPPRLAPGRGLETALDSPLTLDPSAMFRLGVWVACGLIVAYLLVSHRYHRILLTSLRHDPPVRWYLAFALFGALSAAWSLAPVYTAFWVYKLFVGTLVAFLLTVHGRGARPDRPLRLFYYAHAVKLGLLMLLFVVNRPLVTSLTYSGRLGYRLSGGSLLEDYGVSPQVTGLWLLTIGLFGPTRGKRRLAMLGYYATWLPLLLAQGRTVIIIALACYLVMLSLAPSSGGKLTLVVLGCVAFAMVLLGGEFGSFVGMATRGGEGVSNLTGRAEAFSFLMPVWQERPLYGWGLGAGTRSALLNFRALTGLNIGAGHDVLSTVLVDLGMIGAIALVLVFITMWKKVHWLWRRTRGLRQQRVVVAQLLCLAVTVTVSGVFGASITGASGVFFAFLGSAWALGRSLPGGRAGRRSSATRY